jgi:hypothetical protein
MLKETHKFFLSSAIKEELLPIKRQDEKFLRSLEQDRMR